MRKAIFILILSTVYSFAWAQQEGTRLIITADYQQHPFGRDPLWRNWPDGSLSRALTYIRAWRRELGEDRVVLVNVGTDVEDVYALYPEDIAARISAWAGYTDSTTLLPPLELERIAAQLAPDGRTIGVVDFTAPGVYEVKSVDVSGFPVDAAYEEHFGPLIDSIQAWCDTPLAHLAAPAPQTGFLLGPTAYTALFHRFQLEMTGADVSFFAVPRREEEIPAGELTFGDVLRRFRYANELVTLELTGMEIGRILEYAYGLRYNTMRRSTDDLLRLSRDRDGVLQTRSAPYNLDEAAGVCYEVDVTRPAGHRIRIWDIEHRGDPLFDEYYRVALNSHRLSSGAFTRATGLTPEQIAERRVPFDTTDYRLLLRAWLEKQPEITPESADNWRVVPEAFVPRNIIPF